MLSKKLVIVTVEVDGVKFGGRWSTDDGTFNSDSIGEAVTRTIDVLVGDVYDAELTFIGEDEV